MKTVKEFHIAVRQSLQKVASNQNRSYLPDEIDWALNVNQERYVKSRIKRTEVGTGFALDQKLLDDISELITPDVTIKVRKASNSNGYVVLPTNYFELINDKSNIYSNCNSDFTKSTTVNNEYIASVKFQNSTKTSAFYDTFKIIVNDLVLFDNTDYNKAYSSPHEKFALIELILEDVNTYNFNNTIPVNIYWESYKNLYKPDTFIIVSSVNISGSLIVDSSRTNTFTSTNSTYETFLDKTERTVPNRLTNNSYLAEVLGDPFGKSNSDSIVSRISGDNLYVFFDDTFIISDVTIDYIRKPRQISLSLNRMCELRESTHQEIVENTVQYLMLVSENPTYNVKQQDNKINLE